MKFEDRTILLTGGGTGIGRGLAEALHARGARVIVAGRRQEPLSQAVASNPGMQSVILDVADPASIGSVVTALLTRFPALNMVINAAGVAYRDDADGTIDDDVLASTIATNLLGPIRLTSALMPHLKSRPSAAIVHVTSSLAFLPHAQLAIYSASKAALHAYAMSQRYKLRGSSVAVIEIAPPMVATALDNNADNARAMPLADYIAETMQILASGEEDVLVAQARSRRDALRPNEAAAMVAFNDMLTAG